jgi:hypothetical protein
MEIATRNTYVLGNAALADRTIDSGNPIMVCGIVVSNMDDTTEDTVHLTNAAGTTIMTIECNVNDTQTVETPWLADAGLIVTFAGEDVNTAVTILWRPSG